MIRSHFKLPAEGSPVSGSHRVLNVVITPDRADVVAEALRELVGQIPDHPGILPLLDAGVVDGQPFVVTPQIAAESLDEALRVYGPAAVDDALPRIRQLAEALDLCAARGLVHGALEPQDIVVSTDETRVAGIGIAPLLASHGSTLPAASRYTAPEIVHGGEMSPTADQFALAVIAHEWMFGPATNPLDGFVPEIPDLDTPAMQVVFDRATASDPSERFPDCQAFVSALEQCVSPAVVIPPVQLATQVPVVVDLPLTPTAESEPEPEPELEPVVAAPISNSQPTSRTWGPLAIAATLIVGITVGAVAMRMALNALRAAPADDSIEFTEAPLTPSTPGSADPIPVTETPVNPPRDDVPPKGAGAPIAGPSQVAPAAPVDAGLLVHSVPAGAIVSVDGVAHGTTPVVVRGLEFGTRHVVISHGGYRAVERRVTLTPDRPSRALEVELVRATRAPAPRTAAVVTTGSLVIDSRPSGAAVTVDGRPAGTTPVTMSAVAPGRHTVRIERPGYRTVTTTVDVKAGERARVAARLEGGLNEE